MVRRGGVESVHWRRTGHRRQTFEANFTLITGLPLCVDAIVQLLLVCPAGQVVNTGMNFPNFAGVNFPTQ